MKALDKRLAEIEARLEEQNDFSLYRPFRADIRFLLDTVRRLLREADESAARSVERLLGNEDDRSNTIATNFHWEADPDIVITNETPE